MSSDAISLDNGLSLMATGLFKNPESVLPVGFFHRIGHVAVPIHRSHKQVHRLCTRVDPRPCNSPILAQTMAADHPVSWPDTLSNHWVSQTSTHIVSPSPLRIPISNSLLGWSQSPRSDPHSVSPTPLRRLDFGTGTDPASPTRTPPAAVGLLFATLSPSPPSRDAMPPISTPVPRHLFGSMTPSPSLVSRKSSTAIPENQPLFAALSPSPPLCQTPPGPATVPHPLFASLSPSPTSLDADALPFNPRGRLFGSLSPSPPTDPPRPLAGHPGSPLGLPGMSLFGTLSPSPPSTPVNSPLLPTLYDGGRPSLFGGLSPSPPLPLDPWVPPRTVFGISLPPSPLHQMSLADLPFAEANTSLAPLSEIPLRDHAVPPHRDIRFFSAVSPPSHMPDFRTYMPSTPAGLSALTGTRASEALPATDSPVPDVPSSVPALLPIPPILDFGTPSPPPVPADILDAFHGSRRNTAEDDRELQQVIHHVLETSALSSASSPGFDEQNIDPNLLSHFHPNSPTSGSVYAPIVVGSRRYGSLTAPGEKRLTSYLSTVVRLAHILCYPNINPFPLTDSPQSYSRIRRTICC